MPDNLDEFCRQSDLVADRRSLSAVQTDGIGAFHPVIAYRETLRVRFPNFPIIPYYCVAFGNTPFFGAYLLKQGSTAYDNI